MPFDELCELCQTEHASYFLNEDHTRIYLCLTCKEKLDKYSTRNTHAPIHAFAERYRTAVMKAYAKK